MYLLTPPEWKVLSYAVRRIFGFQKRQDNISLSQFIHGTVSAIDGKHLDHGTGLSKPTVISCLDNLMRYKLITKLADNDPVKNDGDLYSLQLDYDLVDYAGLIDRANIRVSADLLRTTQGRNSAEQKRRSLPLNLPGQSDLPGEVVNGIDRGWSMGLTGGGQSHLPGVVNGIDTQYTDGKTEEIQVESISHPDFAKALSLLKEKSAEALSIAAPILLVVDMKPNRMLVKLASVPTGFMDDFRAALYQVSRRSWRVEFETPGTGQAAPVAPERDNRHGQVEPDSNVDQTSLRMFEAMLIEISQDVNKHTYRHLIEPAKLLNVNGTWKLPCLTRAGGMRDTC